jgi:hypothetical protein
MAGLLSMAIADGRLLIEPSAPKNNSALPVQTVSQGAKTTPKTAWRLVKNVY